MRTRLLALILPALAVAGVLGSSAFNSSTTNARGVTVEIAADSASYLQLFANSASPHDCFVDVAAGKVSVTFDTPTTGCTNPAGTGTGVNPGDSTTNPQKTVSYAFHDILIVENRGARAATVWTNATTSSGSSSAVKVAWAASSGTLVMTSYGTSVNACLTPGASRYIGIRIDTGTLSSGTVAGTIYVTGSSTGATAPC